MKGQPKSKPKQPSGPGPKAATAPKAPAKAAKPQPAGKAPKAAPASDERKKRRIRTAVFSRAMKVGVIRRFYVRRLLRYIEKSRKKGRSLPPDLVQVEKMVSRLPRKKQEEVLETALLAKPDTAGNRQLRRAATRQDRLRGSGSGNRPGAMRATGRPPKAPPPGR
jgi:hypothetical protein